MGILWGSCSYHFHFAHEEMGPVGGRTKIGMNMSFSVAVGWGTSCPRFWPASLPYPAPLHCSFEICGTYQIPLLVATKCTLCFPIALAFWYCLLPPYLLPHNFFHVKQYIWYCFSNILLSFAAAYLRNHRTSSWLIHPVIVIASAYSYLHFHGSVPCLFKYMTKPLWVFFLIASRNPYFAHRLA